MTTRGAEDLFRKYKALTNRKAVGGCREYCSAVGRWMMKEAQRSSVKPGVARESGDCEAKGYGG